MGCQNCLTHIQRKTNMIICRFPGRIFISFEAVLVFHRKKIPSGRNLFNAVVETSYKMCWVNFWGDIFWDHWVILMFFWNMSGTKWTFWEKFCLSCQYGLLNDHRNISKDETIWKQINLSSFFLHLQVQFRKFAQIFGQHCQNCNQRVHCTYLIKFSEVFFWNTLKFERKKIGVDWEAFQHDYENNNQCFQKNILWKFPWEHSKL